MVHAAYTKHCFIDNCLLQYNDTPTPPSSGQSSSLGIIAMLRLEDHNTFLRVSGNQFEKGDLSTLYSIFYNGSETGAGELSRVTITGNHFRSKVTVTGTVCGTYAGNEDWVDPTQSVLVATKVAQTFRTAGGDPLITGGFIDFWGLLGEYETAEHNPDGTHKSALAGAGLTGGDGTAFSVKCDESTLTTGGGILAVKDHGIGREKLKERLYGRYKMNLSTSKTINAGENVIPFNNQVWLNDPNNLVDITSSESTFVITANQNIALRISVFQSVEEWASPENGASLILKCIKDSSNFALDQFIVQNKNSLTGNSVSLRGSNIIYLSEDDTLQIIIDNQSGVTAKFPLGECGSHVVFEEI